MVFDRTCTPARHPCPGGQHARAGADAHQSSPDHGADDTDGCSDFFQYVAAFPSDDLDLMCCRCDATAGNMSGVIDLREGLVTAVGNLAEALADAVSEFTKEAHGLLFYHRQKIIHPSLYVISVSKLRKSRREGV
jgi:hypothetical protein